jgi:nicotinate-nucleotide adenylyltransferase
LPHQRIGILGGTFNPVHYGHLAASEEVRERLHLDLVLFVPSNFPPHKQEEDLPSADQRLEMVRLAIAGNAHFMVSDIEVRRKGKSYTVDTIQALRGLYPGSDLFFITGLDSFLDIRAWNQWQKLLSLCAFVVLSRPGYRFSDLLKMDFMENWTTQLSSLDRGEINQVVARRNDFILYLERIPHYDISSTDIRARVRERRPVKYLLPEPVEHYIIKNKFYV